MMLPPLYILSSSCLCAQDTFHGMNINEIVSSEENLLTAFPCDFKAFINPVQIRRMSRVLKMGFASALRCLQQMPEHIPEAIAVGTGKGSLSDTEQFLIDIKTYHETALNSIPFIQSTYNQLSGMIALNKKIDSYNTTYVHRAFSLESAIIDLFLFFDETDANTALVGCYDEITVEHFQVKKQWGYWKKEEVSNLNLLDSNTEGTIAGEGAGFMLLSKHKPLRSCVAILGVYMLYKPKEDLIPKLIDFLATHQLTLMDIDVVMSGWNGDASVKSACLQIEEACVHADVAYFKHLSGEYDTAVHAGVYFLQHILETQTIPKACAPKRRRSNSFYRYALLYNNFFQVNQTFWLFQYENN